MIYEYKVVPAPSKGLKSKGLKTSADRFSFALQTALNEIAADGWDFVRAETLPSEEREGLMGKTTAYQNVLVFKRPLVQTEQVEIAGALPAPADDGDEGSDDLTANETEETEGVIEPEVDQDTDASINESYSDKN